MVLIGDVYGWAIAAGMILAFSGIFGMRIFSPLFMAGLVLRIPWDSILSGWQGIPEFLYSWKMLTAYLVLAVVEWALMQDTDCRRWSNRIVFNWLRPLLAGGLYWLWSDGDFLKSFVVLALATWIGYARARLHAKADVADPDESLMLVENGALLEDLTVLCAMVLVLPALVWPNVVGLMALGSGVGIHGVVLLLCMWFLWRKNNGLRLCSKCQMQYPVYAFQCPHCREENPQLRGISQLGFASTRLVGDSPAERLAHRRALLENNRCPYCGERLGDAQECPKCGANPWEGIMTPEQLVASVDSRALPIFAVALVPGGMLPVSLLYRPLLVRHFSLFLPGWQRLKNSALYFVMEVVLGVLLLLLCWVPLLGALAVLPMLWRYRKCRRDFLRAMGKSRNHAVVKG